MKMKAYSGFKSEGMTSKTAPLPAGAYVAKIKAAKVEGREPDEWLILRVDVAEGEHAGYFLNRYNRDKQSSKFEPKYKGDYKLRIPNDENKSAPYPESDIKRFNAMVYCLEKSNPGYRWDWDDPNLVQGLAGKMIGISMQEGNMNGYPFTKIARLEIVDDVRKGLVKPLKAMEPRSDAYEPPVDQQTGFVQVVDDGLPF